MTDLKSQRDEPDPKLRALLARALAPRELHELTGAELDAALDAEPAEPFTEDQVEFLLEKLDLLMREESRRSSRPPADSDGPSTPPTSPVLGFLGDLMRSDGWPNASTFGGFMIAALTAISLALSVAVAVLVVRFTHQPSPRDAAQPGRVANSPAPSAFGTRPTPSAAVACLTRMCDIRWAGPQFALAEMDRLAPGQDLKLDAGRAEINLDSGVQLFVEGPAHVRILDPLKIQAYSGNISARVGKSAHGFSVLTPQGKVVDLGTEFGLRIDASGREDVAVFEGTVDVDYRMPAERSAARESPAQATRRLVQGEGISVAAGGEMSRLVAISDETFPRQVRPLPARRLVITSVTDNLGRSDCRKFYEIVHHGLDDGARAYVDWQHNTWGVPGDRVPAALRGADYVKMFNDDLNRRDVEVTVHLACAADLYVLVDDRTLKYGPPKWLIDNPTKWKRMDWKIAQDARDADNKAQWVRKGQDTFPGASFSVFRLTVTGPQEVKLGGNGRYSAEEVELHKDTWNADMAMYGIAAVARPEAARQAEKQATKQR